MSGVAGVAVAGSAVDAIVSDCNASLAIKIGLIVASALLIISETLGATKGSKYKGVLDMIFTMWFGVKPETVLHLPAPAVTQVSSPPAENRSQDFVATGSPK